DLKIAVKLRAGQFAARRRKGRDQMRLKRPVEIVARALDSLAHGRAHPLVKPREPRLRIRHASPDALEPQGNEAGGAAVEKLLTRKRDDARAPVRSDRGGPGGARVRHAVAQEVARGEFRDEQKPGIGGVSVTELVPAR